MHHVNPVFKSYKNGIFDAECNGKLNHAAVAVGYDLSGDLPYIEIRNAWGREWGDNGYYKLSLGKNLTRSGKGHCNMFDHTFNVVPSVY